MSFIKRGLSKVWDFVKKYWVQIAMVAAVVFTAGIATVGFAAFSSAVGTQGFFSAVGSTMWAGVTGTAASLGVGGGASGSVAAAAGVTGQGLGAAYGAGSAGMGFGVTSSEYAANAAAAGLTATEAGKTAAIAAAEKGAEVTVAEGVGQGVAEQVVAHTTTNPAAVGQALTTEAGKATAAEIASGAAAEGGMTTAEAMMWSTGLTTVGQGVMGYAQASAMEGEKPLASWGYALRGSDRDNQGPAEDYWADYLKPDAPGAPDAGLMADAAGVEATASTRAPITGITPGNPGGYEERNDFDFGYKPKPLMGGYA